MANTKALTYIDEWLTSITNMTSIKHFYECEFNTYRLYIEKNGTKLVASCDFVGTKNFCDYINNLWVYTISMYRYNGGE